MPTQTAADLVTYVLAAAERDKAEVARKLHDELGALLVAAVMDVSWSEQHSSQMTDAGRQRLRRIHGTLAAAIDLKRRLIEDLRPTLLDNVGLYAAMSWQFKAVCEKAAIHYSGEFPDGEPVLSGDSSIAIFRILQDALLLMTLHRGVTRAALRVEVLRVEAADSLVLTLTDDGVQADDEVDAKAAQAATYLKHRVRSMGGSLDVIGADRGTTLRVAVGIDSPGVERPG